VPPAVRDLVVDPVNGAINPSVGILSDAAEMSVPKYIIEFTDAKNTQYVCRASADEGFPLGTPIYRAESNRHSFGESMAVLLVMFVVLVSTVIGVLRKRDSDPQ